MPMTPFDRAALKDRVTPIPKSSNEPPQLPSAEEIIAVVLELHRPVYEELAKR